MRLYLASTSPARLATLRAVGIDPIAIAPGVDEEAAVDAASAEHPDGLLPAAEMVQLLARLKAEAALDPTVLAAVGLAPAQLDGFILGGDSAFELDGTVFGKPHEPAIARERWLQQRGRSGVLNSGHWLIDHRGGGVRGATGRATRATVHFADDIEEAEIDAYIAKAQPFAKPILRHLRAVVHAACPDAEESIKWGMPHFMYRGRMMCGMASFKAHCTFGF